MSSTFGFDSAALPAADAARGERTIADARALGAGGARGRGRAEIRATAEAFEALLLRQLVARMREAQIEGGLFGDGPGAGVYEGMFDDFISDHLTKNSPLGIADMLERQWTADLDEIVSTTPGRPGRGSALSAAAAARAARGYAAALDGPGSALGAGRAGGAPAAERPARISREFGWDRHPVLGRRAHHDGLDFPARRGTPVRAARAGRVVRVDSDDRGYGLQVLVVHPGGIRTRYAHLSTASVRPGQPVTPGLELGAVGSSGRSTGPHLHFEALVDGRPVDPRRVLGNAVGAQVLGRDADETGER